MRAKRKFSPPAVGASALLVIFAVLCLTLFALLSIATVRADGRLAEQTRAAVTGYYAADCRAEAVLAQLRAGEMPDGVTRQDNVYTDSCPISQTQALMVQVKMQGTSYEILRWQAVSTVDWQADDRLPVWTGQED